MKHKDIKNIETFRRHGDNFKKVWSDDEHHIYIFERRNKHYPAPYFEVVKGRKITYKDGDVVYAYPADSDFGIYGYCVYGADPNYKQKIEQHILQLIN